MFEYFFGKKESLNKMSEEDLRKKFKSYIEARSKQRQIVLTAAVITLVIANVIVKAANTRYYYYSK